MAVLFFLLFFKMIEIDLIGSIVFALSIVVPVYVIADKSLTKDERLKIMVIYIIAFFVLFFWVCFEQAGASLTYFAEVQTDRTLNWFIPANLIIVISALLAVGLGYLFSLCLKEIRQSFRSLETVYGLFILAAAALLVWLNIPLITGEKPGIDIATMPASFFQSFNPIFIVVFASVLAMFWTSLGKKNIEPGSPMKQAMGLFLLALGYLFIAFGSRGLDESVKVSMFWLIGLYFLHTMGELCLSPIGLSMVNKLSPPRFASLLMGIWFMSTASANKLAGVLSGLYPEKGKPVPVFMGYHIENLYQYFMLFVFIAGIAAIILFFLSGWLQKKMQDK
jgi:POT family proton-dependent oligopeptide transporter